MAIKVKTYKFVDIDPVEAIEAIKQDVIGRFIIENGKVYEDSSNPVTQLTECTWLPQERVNQLVTMHNGITAILDWYNND